MRTRSLTTSETTRSQSISTMEEALTVGLDNSTMNDSPINCTTCGKMNSKYSTKYFTHVLVNQEAMTILYLKAMPYIFYPKTNNWMGNHSKRGSIEDGEGGDLVFQK